MSKISLTEDNKEIDLIPIFSKIWKKKIAIILIISITTIGGFYFNQLTLNEKQYLEVRINLPKNNINNEINSYFNQGFLTANKQLNYDYENIIVTKNNLINEMTNYFLNYDFQKLNTEIFNNNEILSLKKIKNKNLNPKIVNDNEDTFIRITLPTNENSLNQKLQSILLQQAKEKIKTDTLFDINQFFLDFRQGQLSTINEIQDLFTLYEDQIEFRNKLRIEYLKKQAEIAKKLNILEYISDSPYYLRGYDLIKVEISTINDLGDSSKIQNYGPYLNSYDQIYEINYYLTKLEKLKKKIDNTFNDNIGDLYEHSSLILSVKNEKSKFVVILSSFIAGLILVFIYLIFNLSFSKRKLISK